MEVMSADGSELLALALSLDADGVDEDEAVDSLVMTAEASATTLMGACAYALSLSRDMPYDRANEHTLALLTRAAQQAVRICWNVPSGDRAWLLHQIVEASGRASIGPRAVASRSAEVEADVGKLRALVEVTASAAP